MHNWWGWFFLRHPFTSYFLFFFKECLLGFTILVILEHPSTSLVSQVRSRLQWGLFLSKPSTFVKLRRDFCEETKQNTMAAPSVFALLLHIQVKGQMGFINRSIIFLTINNFNCSRHSFKELDSNTHSKSVEKNWLNAYYKQASKYYTVMNSYELLVYAQT